MRKSDTSTPTFRDRTKSDPGRGRDASDPATPLAGIGAPTFRDCTKSEPSREAPPRFFGYGSLVNARTHDNPIEAPATVAGFRRRWLASARRPVSFLSIVEDPGGWVDGVIARLASGDWAALDAREAAYDRLMLPPPHEGVAIYRAAPEHVDPEGHGKPILMSYLETVIGGFLDIFGEAGVERFFASTDGWETPVLDDRAAPLYPRTRPLEPTARALLHDHLAAVGARIVRSR